MRSEPTSEKSRPTLGRGICAAALAVVATLAWGAPAAHAVSFSTPTNNTVGTSPVGVSTGDFNNDGKADVAVANTGTGNVSILLGNGNGTFGAATNYTVGTGPRTIAVGLFNADSNLDLAVSNVTTNNVSILLGTGTGTFGAATNVTAGTGTSPRQVVTADVNNDSKADLITANNNTNNVSVLLGNGTGGFAAATTFAAGTNPRSVAVGQFSADSNLDLAVANDGSANVSILLGTGTGSFGAATNFGVGTNPRHVIATQLDGDSNPDLAVVNNGSNDVSVLLGNGTGGFGTATSNAVGTGPMSVAASDLDGDGKKDLLVVNVTSATVTALLGNGSGGFSSTKSFAVGNNPAWPAVADFNGDPKPDLVVSSGITMAASAAQILLGQYEPTISTVATANATIGASIGDKATIASGVNPTGSITFKAYGPGDADCSAAPAFTSSAVAVSGNGSYDSPSFTPTTAGTYRWVASYTGDSTNAAAVGACNAANETSVVAKKAPAFATSADAGAKLGDAIGDTATLSGGYSPTGSITFKAYGPGDADCSGAPAFTSAAVPVSGNGDYDSGDFTPSALGTYRWVASYSGDANNEAATGACNDAGEASVVSKATPTLITAATGNSTVNDPIADHATLSGGHSPGGTLVFKAYGPGDATCSGAPAFTSGDVAVSGNGGYDSPTFTPTVSGTYRWIATYSGDGDNEATAGACNDAGETTVVSDLPTPTFSTTATASVNLGQAISDRATLAGLDPSGSIVFRAYGPGDATCTGSAAFTSSPVSVNGDGDYDSPEFTPTTAGTYRWIASYSGDDDNAAATGACNDAGETSVVAKLSPSLATSATVTASIGDPIADHATIAGGSSPGGSITFKAYGPGDASCSSAPAFTSSAVNVSGAGTYDSPQFTPTTAGAYRWVAAYSGDVNNAATTGACNDADETSTVTKRAPTLATTATDTVALGQAITDKATIAGAYAAGGSIVFRAYGPGDATCSAAPAFTSTAVSVSGNGEYTSPAFTPAALGTYRWIASYGGDANNDAAAGICGDAGETSVVKAKPTLATTATAGALVGGSSADQATLSGGQSPTGSITFRAYAPGDTTCSGTPAFVSSPVPVSGAGTYDSPSFTVTAVGIYRWIATYSGDAGNVSVSGICSDTAERTIVGKANSAVASQASAAVTIGGAVHDRATLDGGYQMTGTVTFRLYGPDDSDCTGTPVYESPAVTVNGAGDYDSPDFTPTATGTYRWIASYSGDSLNKAVDGLCNDPAASVDVNRSPDDPDDPADPDDPSLALGEVDRDRRRGTATVAAAVTGTGRITVGGIGVQPATVDVSEAGTVSLPVSAVGKARRTLLKRGKLKLTVTVAYAVEKRSPLNGSVKVKLVKRKR